MTIIFSSAPKGSRDFVRLDCKCGTPGNVASRSLALNTASQEWHVQHEVAF